MIDADDARSALAELRKEVIYENDSSIAGWFDDQGISPDVFEVAEAQAEAVGVPENSGGALWIAGFAVGWILKKREA